jgi:hypothetical protein
VKTKLVGWAIVAFVAFYIVTQPVAAAHAFQGLLGGLKSAATYLGTFISHA